MGGKNGLLGGRKGKWRKENYAFFPICNTRYWTFSLYNRKFMTEGKKTLTRCLSRSIEEIRESRGRKKNKTPQTWTEEKQLKRLIPNKVERKKQLGVKWKYWITFTPGHDARLLTNGVCLPTHQMADHQTHVRRPYNRWKKTRALHFCVLNKRPATTPPCSAHSLCMCYLQAWFVCSDPFSELKVNARMLSVSLLINSLITVCLS